MRAFRGDERLKRELQERLNEDFAKGAIGRDATARREGRGSIVGTLLQGADLSCGEERLGIPAEVLALLDHFGGHIYFSSISPADLARDFMSACAVGADLRSVAPSLIGRLRRNLIDDLRVAAESDAHPPLETDNNRDVADDADARQLARTMQNTEMAPDAICAVIDQWLEVHGRTAVRRLGWSEAQETAAQSALQRLWQATKDQRRAGEWPDYPTLFRQSDPELAAGYERALDVQNRSYTAGVARVVEWFITDVAAATDQGTETRA